MWKIFLLPFLAVALAEGLDEFFDGKNKIYSGHVQHTVGTLKISTGELKLFAGHAMNIILNKCPAVDAHKVFQVQKYFGKLIAKRSVVPGSNKAFHHLLESMTTCAKEKSNKSQIKAHHIKHSLPEFRSFNPFVFHEFKPEQPLPIINEFPEASPSTKSPSSEVLEQEEPEHKVITTTIYVRPEDVQEGVRSSGGFFNWVRNLFGKMNNMMKNMFSFGSLRSKRDVSEMQPSEPSNAMMKYIAPVFFPSPVTDEIPSHETLSQGKKTFGLLVDEMCRLYCDKCYGRKQINNFKRAAKQLLEFVFEEDSGLDFAATKYVDPTFLKSIQDC